MSTSPNARRFLLLNLGLLLALAAWLRVFSLESIPQHNSDESYIGLQGWRMLHGEPFAWRTTSGNPVDPFLVLMQAPFQWLMGPSLLSLRIPAAISGILAVALAFPLLRKDLGDRAAGLAAVSLATIPIAIAFSRHGLEYSQTPLIGVLAAWGAWRGRPVASFAILICGLLVHPTNIFLIPVWLPIFLVKGLAARSGDRPAMGRWGIGTALVLALVLVPFALWARSNPNVQNHADASRNPALLLRNFGRYLMHDMSISGRATGARDIAFALIIWPLMTFGAIAAILRKRWDRLAAVAGLILGFVAFDAKAGAEVLDGPAYRYGTVFLVPFAIGLALMLEEGAEWLWSSRPTRIPAAAWAAGVLLGWVGLLGVWDRQFVPYFGDGVDAAHRLRSRDAFEEALKFIRRDIRATRREGKAVVLAQDLYLNGLQIEYLAGPDRRIEVKPLIDLFDVWRRQRDIWAFVPQQEVIRKALEAGGYVVQLEGSDPMRGGKLIADTIGAAYPRERVKVYQTKPWGGQALTVFRLRDVETASREAIRR